MADSMRVMWASIWARPSGVTRLGPSSSMHSGGGADSAVSLVKARDMAAPITARAAGSGLDLLGLGPGLDGLGIGGSGRGVLGLLGQAQRLQPRGLGVGRRPFLVDKGAHQRVALL